MWRVGVGDTASGAVHVRLGPAKEQVCGDIGELGFASPRAPAYDGRLIT